MPDTRPRQGRMTGPQLVIAGLTGVVSLAGLAAVIVAPAVFERPAAPAASTRVAAPAVTGAQAVTGSVGSGAPAATGSPAASGAPAAGASSSASSAPAPSAPSSAPATTGAGAPSSTALPGCALPAGLTWHLTGQTPAPVSGTPLEIYHWAASGGGVTYTGTTRYFEVPPSAAAGKGIQTTCSKVSG